MSLFDPPDYEALAKRVEEMGDIECPLCGETGFDVPGFVVSHIDGCEGARDLFMSRNNQDVANNLRAKAA